MGRPHTFAGGALAWPLYVPYELYGRVDPVYSIEAYHSGLGWTGAQGLGNIFETLAYVAYLYIVIRYGCDEGRADGVLGSLGVLGRRRRVHGFWGAVASLVGYTTFMVTVAKSVLYCEYIPGRAVVAESLTSSLKGTWMPLWVSRYSGLTAGSILSSFLQFPSTTKMTRTS